MTAISHTPRTGASSITTVLRDAYRGFVDLSHSGLALLGTALAVALIVLIARADLRADAEQQLLGWLLQRHDPSAIAALTSATEPATPAAPAIDAAVLPEAQAKVAQWLGRKYRVAPEPLGALVAEAFAIGQQQRLDPTLILAVMAIESRFNPYAESPVGAQGLMQVLTRVHTDKFEHFGGEMAAFDPLANLRVGVKVLQDCIKQAGSIEGGLRRYVGAVTTDGAGYINKVMAEHLRIQSVALGKPMPTRFPVYTAAPAATPQQDEPDLSTQTGLLEAEQGHTPDGQLQPAAAETVLTSS